MNTEQAKTVIIAIVGPSGCGKTLMAKYLLHHLGIPTVVSCTTRPPRPDERQGVEHIFVSEAGMPPKDRMLAYTKFGGYHYWAMPSQVDGKEMVSYVIDEKGLLGMMERFDSRYDILPVLIKRDAALLEAGIDPERRERDRHRVTIEESGYFAVIENNGTQQDFALKIHQLINNIKKWQLLRTNNR